MKKSFTILLAVFVAVNMLGSFIITASAEDRSYDAGKGGIVYISDSGNDSGKGTKDDPFKTLPCAFKALSDEVRTADNSGGYIVITDSLTLMDSEDGKITNTVDSKRYSVALTSKCTNMITLCGLNGDSALIFANSYGEGQDHGSYQGNIEFSCPFTFSDINITYSNGRLIYNSSSFLCFTDTAATSTSNDVYIYGSGTFKFSGGSFNHIFTPTVDKPTCVFLGGNAVVNYLWLGLGTVTNNLSVDISGEAQINTVYLGGQSTNFSGDTNIIISGGYISTVTPYSGAVIKGKTNIFYAGDSQKMPALSSDADNVFLLDYYFKDGISDELLPYSFNGVLKYMSADLPAGFSAEEAETVAYYKYTALDTSKNKIDFPFSSYALRIPDGYLASPGYAVYAFADGKTVKCDSVITGTDSKTMTFGAVAGADGYALVHLGGPAPIKQQAEPDEPEETGSPETGNSDNVPSTAGTDTKINNNTAPISKTAVIIIAIAGVTAVLEALLILKFKKPPKKT